MRPMPELKVEEIPTSELLEYTRNAKIHTARCVTSTAVGELTDAAVFNLGMWLGILPIEMILTTIVTYGLGKVLYEIVVYPLTRLVIRKVKEIPDNEETAPQKAFEAA